MASSELPSVAEAIDRGRLSPCQWMIFILCAITVLLGGWDTQSIGIVAPLIRFDLHLDQTQVGSIFAVGQLGATVGALTFGALADRFGRKPLILLSTALIAVFTWMTAMAHGYGSLLLVRLASGVGLGGAIPCVLALASEFAPKRLRGLVVTGTFAAYPLGAAIGGLVSAQLVSFSDWRLVFYVGGVLPTFAWLVTFVLMPESAQYLANQGHVTRVAAVLRRLRLKADPTRGREGTRPATTKRVTHIRRLFVGDLAAASVLLLMLYFFAFATTKIVAVWLPSILQQSGLSLAVAARAQASLNIGAAVGAAASGWLTDRFGPGAILAPALVTSSACVLLLGALLNSATVVCVLAALIGIVIGIGAVGANAVAVLIYVPSIRSTGLGLGIASSRFGQVLSPLMIGIMLSAGAAGPEIFMTVAVLPLMAALAVLFLMFGPARRVIHAARCAPGV